ncbi:hypothetical protein BVI1335_1590040 [Burkholderia vietnamiensis]|nr:hypothetical protein BVI1335_1590040 [Burkholderia vietnamiensis]
MMAISIGKRRGRLQRDFTKESFVIHEIVQCSNRSRACRPVLLCYKAGIIFAKFKHDEL